MTTMDRYARDAAKTYGPQPTTPDAALAHVLCAFAQQPDDAMVITVTDSIYGDGVRTGLTFGDLRAIQLRLDQVEQPTDAGVIQFPNRR